MVVVVRVARVVRVVRATRVRECLTSIISRQPPFNYSWQVTSSAPYGGEAQTRQVNYNWPNVILLHFRLSFTLISHAPCRCRSLPLCLTLSSSIRIPHAVLKHEQCTSDRRRARPLLQSSRGHCAGDTRDHEKDREKSVQ